MKGRLALGLAVLALLGACSSSEAKEAADASEPGYPTPVERPAPTAEELEAALDQVLFEELSAEAGVELSGQPVPCVDRPSEVRPGADWVTDTSRPDLGITLVRPPDWEVGGDIQGWAAGDINFGPSFLIFAAPLGDSGLEMLPKDLQLGSPSSILQNVDAVERLDEDSCFVSGTGPAGQRVAITVYLPDHGDGALLVGMALGLATAQDIEEMETALRFVEFGPS